MVESDYPHADSSWPDTQAVLAANWGALPDDELRAVAGGNAGRPVPPPAAAGGRLAPPGVVSGRAPRCPTAPAPSSMPTVTSSNPSAPGPGCPTRTGPRINATPGYEHVVVGDTEILAVPLGTLARPGSTFDDPASLPTLGRRPARRLATRWPAWTTWTARASTRPCCTRPSGCTSAAINDPAAAVAWPRAYNDWLAWLLRRRPTPAVRGRHAAAAGSGGRGARAPPRRRRARPPWPASSGPTPAWAARCRTTPTTSVWDAAEELGVPIGIHEGSSVIVPDSRVGPPLQSPDPPCGVPLLRGDAGLRPTDRLRHTRAPSGAALRLPGVLAAGGRRSGSSAWTSRRSRSVASAPTCARPSEYFARQCAISFEVDEQHVAGPGRRSSGGDRIVWGSDYPHHDATFPGAVDAIRPPWRPARPPPRSTCWASTPAGCTGSRRTRRRGRAAPRLLHRRDGAGHRPRAGAVRTTTPCSRAATCGCRGSTTSAATTARNTFTYEDFRPAPGTPTFEGTRIDGGHRRPSGRRRHSVHDVFETDGTRITSLHVSGFEEALRRRH